MSDGRHQPDNTDRHLPWRALLLGMASPLRASIRLASIGCFPAALVPVGFAYVALPDFGVAQPAVPASAPSTVAGTPGVVVNEATNNGTRDPIKALLAQVSYWQARGQPGSAQHALDRILAVAPNNPDALVMLAQLRLDRGETSAAQATLTRLRAVKPDDPRVARLEQAVRVGPIDPAGLAEARRLAQQNQGQQAVTHYRSLFRGNIPPANLALEYYQTLAGSPAGWDEARTGLAAMVTADPRNMRAQLAYAELLTYREATRLDGISRLATLSGDQAISASAISLWRQALRWLPNDASSIPAYQTWVARYPDDTSAVQRLAALRSPVESTAVGANDRGGGFAALNNGRLAEAQTAFEAALQRKSDDADALGGLGLVRLRQGRGSEAQELLARAIALDPDHRSRWEAALRGAQAGVDYARARAQVDRGQLDAAEQTLRTIISGGGETTGALAMLASVQARRGELADAEASYRGVLRIKPGNTDAVIGLAQVLGRLGRAAEVDQLLSQAEATGGSKALGKLRGSAAPRAGKRGVRPCAARGAVAGGCRRRSDRSMDPP